jgi:transcriptional regulator with XRE-family HTH domain
MGTRKVELGAAGHNVKSNLRRLREARGYSLLQLSERMTEVGRPILPSGISKIEQGDRRVDVDDLVAFAEALHVGPNLLLMDPNGSGAAVGPDGLTRLEHEAAVFHAGQMIRNMLEQIETTDTATATDELSITVDE